jgi:hypothetical protein
LGCDFPSGVLLTNIGEDTVYLGTVDNTSTSQLVGPNAYPLRPGETVSIPPVSDDADRYYLAANTDGGTSEIRFLHVAP